MNKTILHGLIVLFLVGVLVSGYSAEKPKTNQAAVASKPLALQTVTGSHALTASASPAPKAGSADYSQYLSLGEVQGITGKTNLRMKSVDAQKSGEMPDLTYSTADGAVILTIQVLKGSDYDRYYNQLRCQDYKPMEYAFWGPTTATPANPPNLLGFRKGNIMILIESKYDANKRPYFDVEMMEKAAQMIASRL